MRHSDGHSLCLSTETWAFWGAVIGSGVFRVVELKRDPRAPLSCVMEFAQDNRRYIWDTTLDETPLFHDEVVV